MDSDFSKLLDQLQTDQLFTAEQVFDYSKRIKLAILDVLMRVPTTRDMNEHDFTMLKSQTMAKWEALESEFFGTNKPRGNT